MSANFDPRTAKLLPREQWIIERVGADHVAAGIYDHPPGWMWHVKLPLADLPNETITREDLARFGIEPAGEACR